jgi:hypothetical protein
VKPQLLMISLLAVATVSGCATAMGGRSATSIPIANYSAPLTFQVPKVSKAGRLNSERDIVVALLDGMRREIPDLGVQASTPGFGPDTNSIGGVRFDFAPQLGSFEASWKWAQALNHNYLTASMPLMIRDNGATFEVTLRCPSHLSSDVSNFSLVGIPQWQNDRIGESLTSACLSGPAAVSSLT